MMSLSVPHSLPRSRPLQFNPLRMAPSFHRFPLFLCSANNSQNSSLSVRLRAAHQPVAGKLEMERFASISSSNSQETSSVAVNPQVSTPLQLSSGSPLFWIGVGVVFSALYIMAAASLQKYAKQQVGQMNSQNDQSSNTAIEAFVDVTPEETEQKSPFESSLQDVTEQQNSQNGASFKQGVDAPMGSQSTGKANSAISVEALENMLKDPEVQNMVYPYFPEEMRNPTTFKWILENPQYRQQLEDILGKLTGNSEWDNRKMDSLKNFDFSSPEVKQQFDYIGVTPEEVISKIMANPEVAMGFQNPRVQAAIMDCLRNPLSIAKYQNDKEVMDVFNRISDLFPDSSGSP